MDSSYPIQVKPIEDYKLLITFDNGEVRMFDVEPYLTDSFYSPLRSLNIFHSARVNLISIEWDGGIDICPDELYFNSIFVKSINAS